MKVTIYPSQLKGIVQAPASKSSMQRACAAALLAKGGSVIQNPGHSNDDRAALDIIQKLGATINADGQALKIESSGVNPVANKIDCGESGLSIRMFTPIAALSGREITISGSGSLVKRPMDFFDDILPLLGVKIKSNNGKLPMTVKGPLIPDNIEVDGSLSSQFLTGLLMAYGAIAENKTIKVKNLSSKPYIALTLAVMKQFGVEVENRNFEEFFFKPAGAGYKETIYTVEGDWSGGAFLLVAGAIAGPVTVQGLDLMSTQADKAIYTALTRANASIVLEAKGLKVYPSALKGFEFDATDCPDLFPPLVALAAYCKGETKIKGAGRLTYKESNRAETLMEEFGKMGVKIELNNEMMTIRGADKVIGGKVHSHHDHRIAMACAVAALKADDKTIIEEAQAVKKSYPDFYADLKKAGAVVRDQFSIFDKQ